MPVNKPRMRYAKYNDNKVSNITLGTPPIIRRTKEQLLEIFERSSFKRNKGFTVSNYPVGTEFIYEYLDTTAYRTFQNIMTRVSRTFEVNNTYIKEVLFILYQADLIDWFERKEGVELCKCGYQVLFYVDAGRYECRECGRNYTSEFAIGLYDENYARMQAMQRLADLIKNNSPSSVLLEELSKIEAQELL